VQLVNRKPLANVPMRKASTWCAVGVVAT